MVLAESRRCSDQLALPFRDDLLDEREQPFLGHAERAGSALGQLILRMRVLLLHGDAAQSKARLRPN